MLESKFIELTGLFLDGEISTAELDWLVGDLSSSEERRETFRGELELHLATCRAVSGCLQTEGLRKLLSRDLSAVTAEELFLVVPRKGGRSRGAVHSEGLLQQNAKLVDRVRPEYTPEYAQGSDSSDGSSSSWIWGSTAVALLAVGSVIFLTSGRESTPLPSSTDRVGNREAASSQTRNGVIPTAFGRISEASFVSDENSPNTFDPSVLPEYTKIDTELKSVLGDRPLSVPAGPTRESSRFLLVGERDSSAAPSLVW